MAWVQDPFFTVNAVYIAAVEPYNRRYNLLQLKIKCKLLPILKYMYLVIYPAFPNVLSSHSIQMEFQLPSSFADQVTGN